MTAEELAHELRTQDNASTKDPIFMVQRRKRIYGVEVGWRDDVVIDNDDCVGYKDIWVNEQPFFTRKSAEAYLVGREPSEWRIYVESGHRNHEWRLARAMFLREGQGNG